MNFGFQSVARAVVSWFVISNCDDAVDAREAEGRWWEEVEEAVVAVGRMQVW